MIRSFTLVLIFGLLYGCTFLPERKAQRTFALPTSDIASMNGAAFDLTLNLPLPKTQTPHGSSQILVNRSNNELQAYPGALWSKPVPQLLQSQLIKGIRERGLFRAIIGESSTGRTDLVLTSDLTEFELAFSEQSTEIVISLNVQLIDQNSRNILEATRFRVTQPVASEPVEVVIEGFGIAALRLNRELIEWLEGVIPSFYEGTDPATQP